MLCSIVAVLIALVVTDCARILVVVPMPAISHQVVFRPITQELARRGHEVVMITTNPAFPKGQAPANLTEIDVGDLSYRVWRKSLLASGPIDFETQIHVCQSTVLDVFMMQLETEEVKDLIKNQKFDLLLLEAFITPPLFFTHLFKAPAILISTFGGYFGNYEMLGAPSHPLAYPMMGSRKKINNLSLWDKFSELYMHFQLVNLYSTLEESAHKEFTKRFGPDVPSISELKKNVDLLLLNVHPIWETNRPVPPNIVYMGGMHQHPENPLPKDIETYLNSSKNGVVYISFGSNISPSLLPPVFIQTLLKTFSQLPYDVMWKWDKAELPGKTDNIRIFKWLPQSDILRHPKVKVFITQGGLQSTDEAVLAGVPLIGIPMVGDQWFNTEKYESFGLGIRLIRDTVTVEKLKAAIDTIINDESYRHNVEKFRDLVYDQPQKPLERAIWWIEHIARHGGGDHLRSPSADMSWSEFFMLDVVVVGIIIMLVLLSMAIAILKYLIQNLSNKSYTKVKLS